MADMNDRKKQIMEHIARTKGDYIRPTSTSSSERKQQIRDHIKRTRG